MHTRPLNALSFRTLTTTVNHFEVMPMRLSDWRQRWLSCPSIQSFIYVFKIQIIAKNPIDINDRFIGELPLG